VDEFRCTYIPLRGYYTRRKGFAGLGVLRQCNNYDPSHRGRPEEPEHYRSGEDKLSSFRGAFFSHWTVIEMLAPNERSDKRRQIGPGSQESRT